MKIEFDAAPVGGLNLVCVFVRINGQSVGKLMLEPETVDPFFDIVRMGVEETLDNEIVVHCA